MLENALQYAAMKTMKAMTDAALLQRADAGVLVAFAGDASVDWRARLEAARLAAAAGVLSGAKLKALYHAAPEDVAGAYKSIRAMTAPELLRDKAGRVAAEIAAASSFSELYATALLYADDLRALEGAVVPENEAEAFATARLAAGDAVAAERWLQSVAPAAARGMPEEGLMRYIDLVGVLGALEPAAAARVAAAANVSIAPPRTPVSTGGGPTHGMASVVAAAIDGAARGAKGQSALAALAASDAANAGDPVAVAVFERSLGAAGLSDILRRRAVEDALAAMYPSERATDDAAATAATPAAPVADKMLPRLKPKRES
jgi:hypothetical protein